jgi:hypothetical protein
VPPDLAVLGHHAAELVESDGLLVVLLLRIGERDVRGRRRRRAVRRKSVRLRRRNLARRKPLGVHAPGKEKSDQEQTAGARSLHRRSSGAVPTRRDPTPELQIRLAATGDGAAVCSNGHTG